MKKAKGLFLAALLLTAGPVRAQFPGATADDWQGPWPPPLPNMPGRPGLLGRPGLPGRPNSALPGGAAALWGPAPGPLSTSPPNVPPEILPMLQPPAISPNLPTVPPVLPPVLPSPPLAAAPQGPPPEPRWRPALVMAGACVAAALLYALLRRKPAA